MDAPEATEWSTPELLDVNMSSEIGGYQDEFDPERDPRFVEIVAGIVELGRKNAE